MRRTYLVPFSRAGLAGLVAALVLLCLPGTSIAGGASNTSRALGSGLLQYGAGYGKPTGAPPGARRPAQLRRRAGSLARGRVVRPADKGRSYSFSKRRTVRRRRHRRPADAASADARAEGVAPAGSRLRAARRIAAGACAPGQVAQARASARPGGRPLRAAYPGRGRAAPAPQRGAREWCRHRQHRRLLAHQARKRRSSAPRPRPRRAAEPTDRTPSRQRRHGRSETCGTGVIDGSGVSDDVAPADRDPDRTGCARARPARGRAAGPAQQGRKREPPFRSRRAWSPRARHQHERCRPLPRTTFTRWSWAGAG